LFFQKTKTGLCNLWPAASKVAQELKFSGPKKGPDFQASVTVFERFCQCQIMGTVHLRLNRYFGKF